MNAFDSTTQPSPRELNEHYRRGTNITRLLRELQGLEHNPREIIETAYDLQTGSYISGMADPQLAAHKRDYSAEIASVILSLCRPVSILEAGVGEATTLSGVIENLPGVQAYGFDLSWSRVAYARRWLMERRLEDVMLCTGDLSGMPFADNSVDVVYTSHSIEPNGGHETVILRELFRVTRQFLILLEPGYELANEQARRRMEFHGYCQNLPSEAEKLGGEVLRHELFPYTANPLNPTAITIIRKQPSADTVTHVLACPQYRSPLEEIGNMMFSFEALAVYPVIAGIPCLRQQNAVLASKYPEIMGTVLE